MSFSATSTSLTRKAKQNQPVHHQHRPEYGQVENLEPAAEEADCDRLCRRVPELKLWQPAYERPELLVLLRGEATSGAVFHAFILLKRGVEFRGEKGEEEI